MPGWDCHGLPIEWKIEEKYRAKGRNKDDVPINEFRQECREFASHWVGVQSEEFLRLGVTGDFENPYLTMNFKAEAKIAGELMKFAQSGQLYRGSKPIMWSVVEQTALAEAEIEYEIYESDTVWVKFPLTNLNGDLGGASVVIWTTTPWTIPANRAVCFSSKINYALYEVTSAEHPFGPQPGERFIFAEKLAQECFDQAKVEFKKLRDMLPNELNGMQLQHPLKGFAGGYDFVVPMLDGDHVTDDAGTGFVHTAPSHGRDDFEIWMAKAKKLDEMGIDTSIPLTVDGGGYYTDEVAGFGPASEGGAAQVIDHKGKGNANKRVIQALKDHNTPFTAWRIKHEYPILGAQKADHLPQHTTMVCLYG